MNDLFKARNGMLHHWVQGQKVVFMNFDARQFPDIYLKEEVGGQFTVIGLGTLVKQWTSDTGVASLILHSPI